jgi:hypothetical protein
MKRLVLFIVATIFMFIQTPAWGAPLRQEVTVMGIIFEEKSQKVSLVPWILYKNGEYMSLYLDPLLDQKEINAVRWRQAKGMTLGQPHPVLISKSTLEIFPLNR